MSNDDIHDLVKRISPMIRELQSETDQGKVPGTFDRHLRHLVNAGLLDDRREGTWGYFRIVEKPEPAQARVIEMLPAVLDKCPHAANTSN